MGVSPKYGPILGAPIVRIVVCGVYIVLPRFTEITIYPFEIWVEGLRFGAYRLRAFRLGFSIALRATSRNKEYNPYINPL